MAHLLGGLSLVWAVLAVTIAELLLNRIFGRLVQPEALTESMVRAIDDVGLFVFHFASVLSVTVFLMALGRVLRGRAQVQSGARLSIPLVGAIAAVFATLGVFIRLPANWAFHMRLSFVFLIFLVALSCLTTRASRRNKLGALVVVLPPLFEFYAYTLRLRGQATSLPANMPTIALVAACFLSVPLFGSERRPRIFPLTMAIATTLGAAAMTWLSWDLASRVSLLGFGVDLPASVGLSQAWSLSLGALVYTLVSLVLGDEAEQLRGVGLATIFSLGLLVELPGQVAAYAVGMFALLESMTRTAGPRFSRADLETRVKRAAVVLGSQEITLAGVVGSETARVNGAERASLVVTLRRGAVEAVELRVGEVPEKDPPFVVTHHTQSRLGPRSSSPRVHTDDAAFDQLFIVRDRRDAGAALLDTEARATLLKLGKGWLGVWPQRGLLYRSSNLPDGEDGLAQLVAFLIKAAPRPS